jgi:hypothetical protein
MIGAAAVPVPDPEAQRRRRELRRPCDDTVLPTEEKN